MLNDAVGFEKIFIATGYTDLRRGIDGLASTIKFQFDLDPFQKHVLFLFCGKRTDRIKGLVWEGDGFLLLYKRLNIGGFSVNAQQRVQSKIKNRRNWRFLVTVVFKSLPEVFQTMAINLQGRFGLFDPYVLESPPGDIQNNHMALSYLPLQFQQYYK